MGTQQNVTMSENSVSIHFDVVLQRESASMPF
jgi:hypothetical protein